jgi:hypothetical protein
MVTDNKNKIYKAVRLCGGYCHKCELEIDNDNFTLNIYINYMGITMPKNNIMNGKFIINQSNYKVAKIEKYNNSDIEYYLDIYFLDLLNPTIDSTGLTDIWIANCPSVNEYFNCAIYKSAIDFPQNDTLDKLFSRCIQLANVETSRLG